MDCAHNFIRITASTRRPAPYDFCSKCGTILEIDRVIVASGGEIEIAEPMDATNFEPRFNPAAPHSTPERRKV